MSTVPSASDVDAEVASITGAVLAEIPMVRSPRRSRRFKRRAAVSVGAALVVSLTAGGLIALRAAQDEIAYSVACYEGDSLTTRTVTFAAPPTTGDTGEIVGRPRVDPVSTCAEVWRLGVLGDGQPDPRTGDFAVPDIVGCEQTNGIGAGLRRDFSSVSDQYFCARLGMRVWRD